MTFRSLKRLCNWCTLILAALGLSYSANAADQAQAQLDQLVLDQCAQQAPAPRKARTYVSPKSRWNVDLGGWCYVKKDYHNICTVTEIIRGVQQNGVYYDAGVEIEENHPCLKRMQEPKEEKWQEDLSNQQQQQIGKTRKTMTTDRTTSQDPQKDYSKTIRNYIENRLDDETIERIHEEHEKWYEEDEHPIAAKECAAPAEKCAKPVKKGKASN